MKQEQLSTTYKPNEFEDRIYKMWEEKGYFTPSQSEKDPFVVVIPPPNVTGILHMGHGLNNSLQDILARYYRMQGRPTLWLPGTDHAGIATQNVVERKLRAQGVEREALGREAFVDETWKVKDSHHATILKQLKKMGCSCDWSRERFTLDEGLSDAVREVFVSLYEKGIVYRGNYLVNWCTSCGTALSDDEVEHQNENGRMYHILYPLADGSGNLEIATTRPETLLGDTAVAVHPEDERYGHLIGKTVLLPVANREIPIIADSYVDREFGTGVVKITPAHDPNDWEIGNRHNLEKITVMDPQGRLNEEAPEEYRGLTMGEGRKRIVKDLEALGLFVDSKNHPHQVGHCYRCSTVVEPRVSDQWFVKMQDMANKALDAGRKGDITFYPNRWINTYNHWLENIRDWCISRQLWWGHRIPVWYCDDCGEMMVLREDPTVCNKCGSSHIRQEEDVLDTWFSSWLWPFSTLGWPEKTDDLKRFFPTTSLVTGYDIIFFWVARMIMGSLEFLGEVPFKDIYITGLVRDKQGRKMSKSLGNGIDPLDVIEEFGADAMKFTLGFLAAQGQDIPVDSSSFKLGSKFANKIWNATRFLLMNLEGISVTPIDQVEMRDHDLWIYHQLNETAKAIHNAMENYRFDIACQRVYHFFWDDFCDWYVEISKVSLSSDNIQERERSASILTALLEESMRLIHPFLSFVTEEIYQKLPNKKGDLMVAPYPEYQESRVQTTVSDKFTIFQDLIGGVRTLRSTFAISPDKKIPIIIKVEQSEIEEFFNTYSAMGASLMGASELTITTNQVDVEGSIPVAGRGVEAYVYVRDVVDLERELAKLKKELKISEKDKVMTEKKLQNKGFTDRAPADVIEKEKKKLAEFTEKVEKCRRYIGLLS